MVRVFQTGLDASSPLKAIGEALDVARDRTAGDAILFLAEWLHDNGVDDHRDLDSVARWERRGRP